MAINYPTSLDTTTSLPTVVDTTDDVLAIHQNDPRDAILALETKVGINSSSVTSTLDYWMRTGWVLDTDTWVYVSTTSFKIEGKDVTARFPIGTKIWLTQTTSKYFVVTARAFSTDTTITITAGTSYSLADATITAPFYSYAGTPQGFPNYFAYTPTWTNFTIGDASVVGRFQVVGNLLRGSLVSNFGSTSSPGTGNIGFSVPISYGTGVQGYEPPGFGYLYDTAGTTYPIYLMRDAANATNTRMARQTDSTSVTNSAPFTIGNGDILRCTFSYLI